jgi:RNA polymerase sigma-70 factor (ECF subfamily)
MIEAARRSRPDEVLVAEARAGDGEAFDLLLTRHHGAVFRLALAILREEDLAHDAAQETFLKAYRALDRFRGDSAFRTWLLSIAGNEARGLLRKQGRRREMDLDEAPPPATEAPDVPERIDTERRAAVIRRELDSLPEKQRLAVSLRIFDGLSFREVGEIIDSSEGAARVNYHHGIRKLRERVDHV